MEREVSAESVENRLEKLERRVTTLEELPERIDRLELQILQFRGEMRAEFSAVRTEIRDGDVMVVTELTEQIEEALRHTSVLFEDAVGRITVVGEGLAALAEKVETLSLSVERTNTNIDLILTRLDAANRGKRGR
jgi:hypothetical protein